MSGVGSERGVFRRVSDGTVTAVAGRHLRFETDPVTRDKAEFPRQPPGGHVRQREKREQQQTESQPGCVPVTGARAQEAGAKTTRGRQMRSRGAANVEGRAPGGSEAAGGGAQ